MSITATVQDPSIVYTPPTTLIVYASPAAGDSLPSDFHLLVNGSEVNAGATNIFSPGSYTVSETHSGDYVVMFGGDCDASGNILLVSGESHSCNVYYKEQDNTATLTVVANIFPSGGVSDLQIQNNSTGNIEKSGTSPSIVAQVPANVSYTVSATTPVGYQASKWSGACDQDTGVTGDLTVGTNYTCVINFSQPAPACADTVMMLDRTGSMGSTALADERTAAKALLDLYSPLSPAPKVGVGIFNDGSGNPSAPAAIVGPLTTVYSPTLYNAINTWLASSGGFTNLSSAIDVGQNQLSSNGNPAAANVLILISDGQPNRPGSGSGATTQAMNAAYNSADAAKFNDTEIFTIHFGTVVNTPEGINSQEYLARLAKGTFSNSPHQPGSTIDHFLNDDTGYYNPTSYQQNGTGDSWSNPSGAYADGGTTATDNAGHKERYYNFNFPSLSGYNINGIEIKSDAWVSVNSVDTGYKNPTANSPDTTVGDGNGFELNPASAYSDGGGNASNIDGAGDRHGFYNYNFSIPTGAVITGIETRLDWWLNSSYGNNSLGVELSWDGGVSWTSAKNTTDEPTSQTTSILGSSSDTWGRVWSASDFNNNFRIISVDFLNFVSESFKSFEKEN